MEWSMPVNDILKDEITMVNSLLIPPGFSGNVSTIRLMQDNLSKIINQLGEQSSSAQGLKKVITTAEKLRTATNHRLYLLKHATANNGAGAVIGYLKVGYKKLFLFDRSANVVESEPLCVLDFFVKKERQRQGYGRKLFDHMLQISYSEARVILNLVEGHRLLFTAEKYHIATGKLIKAGKAARQKVEGVSPKQLAIDGPSANMAAFLRKNYGMVELLRQSNNFAVTPEFFAKDGERMKNGASGRSTPAATPASVGRFSAPRPHSDIGNIIHGGGSNKTEIRNGGDSDEESTLSVQEGTEASDWPADEERAETAAVEDREAASVASPPPERPSSLLIEPTTPAPTPAPAPPNPDPSPAAGSTVSRRGSQVTDQGYFDIKFYHNKLW